MSKAQKGLNAMAIKGTVKMLNFLYRVLVEDREKLVSYKQDSKPTFKMLEEVDTFLRKTPREEGITNTQVKNFFEVINSIGFNFHNVLILKNAKVIAEASYAPYESDIWSVTHSLAKTVVGIATGMAIDEGYFNLEDNVYELIKGKTRFYTSSGMKRLTVKHLLTMTSGVNFRESNIVATQYWSEAFLSADFTFSPGERFEYNSLNTYMLAVIIYKKTGKTLMDFLEPRLFSPLGIRNIAWEKGPEGIEKAGWGMYITIEGMAKLGQFILQLGEWQVEGVAQQLVSQAWMKDMLRPHEKTKHPEAYGYQIWVDPKGEYYCFSGLFGQTIYINPSYHLVAVFTSGNDSVFNSALLIKAITDHLVVPSPALAVEDDVPTSTLHEFLNSFHYYKEPLLTPVKITTQAPVPKQTFFEKFKKVFGKKQPPLAPIVRKEYPLPDEIHAILNRKYVFKANSIGIVPVIIQMMNNNFAQGLQEISFYEKDNTFYLRWDEALATIHIPIGLYEPIKETIDMNGEQFLISSFAHLTKDEDNNFVLKLTICFLEMTSVRTIKCFFLDQQKQLKLELDESPSVSYLSNTVFEQISRTEFAGFISRDNGYLKFLIDRLTLPAVIGERVEE